MKADYIRQKMHQQVHIPMAGSKNSMSESQFQRYDGKKRQPKRKSRDMQRNVAHQNENPVMRKEIRMIRIARQIAFQKGKMICICKSAYHPLFRSYHRLKKAYYRPFWKGDIDLFSADTI